MMSTDLSTFSDQVEQYYPTIEAYVLHVRAHRKQVGYGGDLWRKPDISFSDFQSQEEALMRSSV